MQEGGEGRAPRDIEMGSRERLPLERGNVRVRGGERSLRGAEVVARERLSVGHEHNARGARFQSSGSVGLVARKRMP